MRPQDNEIKKFINKKGEKVFSDLSVENYDEIQILKVTKADKTDIPDVSIYATKGELADTNLRLDIQENTLSTVITDVDTMSIQISQLQGNVDTLDLEKANKDSVYTKDETNSLLNNKADKSEIPIIPTNISYFNNDSGYINHVKTINGQDIVGTGDIEIKGGGASSFAELEGSPYDNQALADEFDGLDIISLVNLYMQDVTGAFLLDSNGLNLTLRRI